MSQADVVSWERGESLIISQGKRHNNTDGGAVFVASSIIAVVIQKYLLVWFLYIYI